MLKGSNGQTHHLRLFGTHRLTGDLLYSSYGGMEVWGTCFFYPYAAIRQSITLCIPFVTVVGGLEHFDIFFPSYWECHHPNCYSLPWFFRGVGQPPTSDEICGGETSTPPTQSCSRFAAASLGVENMLGTCPNYRYYRLHWLDVSGRWDGCGWDTVNIT